MTEAIFSRWYADKALNDYVVMQARRHANNTDDMADFMQEAWSRVYWLTSRVCIQDCKDEAYRGIHAAYERELRHRKREIPFSRIG